MLDGDFILVSEFSGYRSDIENAIARLEAGNHADHTQDVLCGRLVSCHCYRELFFIFKKNAAQDSEDGAPPVADPQGILIFCLKFFFEPTFLPDVGMAIDTPARQMRMCHIACNMLGFQHEWSHISLRAHCDPPQYSSFQSC